MFVVKRYTISYDGEWSEEVARFVSEDEANAFAETENNCRPFEGERHVVDEE